MRRNIHGAPCAARPIITASAPVLSSTCLALCGVVMSPFAMTGILMLDLIAAPGRGAGARPGRGGGGAGAAAAGAAAAGGRAAGAAGGGSAEPAGTGHTF